MLTGLQPGPCFSCAWGCVPQVRPWVVDKSAPLVHNALIARLFGTRPTTTQGVTITVPMARITVLSAKASQAIRKATHGFSKLCIDDRLAMIFPPPPAHKTTKWRAPKQNHCPSVPSGGHKHVLCGELKAVGDANQLLKSLLHHYIIQPITSYSTLIAIVESLQSYIHDHVKRLCLELYKHNPTVKSVIHDLLMVENGHVRSVMCKLVGERDDTIDDIQQENNQKYHLPTTPKKPLQDIMASLALMASTTVRWLGLGSAKY
ncbi:hypothetical protein B0H14DRAFT_2626858 [Mycena olivaceomarginata]|nr:hypothetical protein B0H14DRAFT_2626858 [Mycena olivaceomarginata]